jgi:hypothetical protein
VQIAVANSMAELQLVMQNMRARFAPSQFEYLEQIGAKKFFIEDLYNEIGDLIKANPLTPAITHQYVSSLNAERNSYIDSLIQLSARLSALGIKTSIPDPGTSEVGFKIPRKLFDGNLDGLISELREIRFIMRSFSEVATASVEPIVLKQISTTDPLFTFIANVATVSLVARAVSWALDTWKTVEEIRKLRAETSKLKIEQETDILRILDSSIINTVEKAIKEKVAGMIPDASDGRPREMQSHLKLALDSLFARIERGMIVEVRFVPPPPEEGMVSAAADSAAFASLAETTPRLVFPVSAGEPVLPLPRPGDRPAG